VNFTSIYWAYASGFPKAQNIAKNISKAIDNLKEKMYNSDIWKKNLNDVKSAEKLYLNELIEAGLLTNLRDFVADDVVQYFRTRNTNVSASIAESNLREVNRILGENIFIVPQNAAILPRQKLSDVQIVELNLDDQNQKMSIRIIFVPVNVQTYICEKVESKIKEDVAQKTENGRQKSWSETDIDALCVEVIEGLKLITLNQLKSILNYGINYQTELPSAINVIITKCIRECLLIKTASILGRREDFARRANKKPKDVKQCPVYHPEDANITVPTTPAAKSLDGSYAGMQLKPAVEVILVAMKPLSEKTYVDQALQNGKGVTWLDEGRIPYKKQDSIIAKNPHTESKGSEAYDNVCYGKYNPTSGYDPVNSQGRFPANLLVSDDALNDGRSWKGKPSDKKAGQIFGSDLIYQSCLGQKGDSGSFSRYFSLDAWFAKKLSELPKAVQRTFPFLIVPKASKAEKNRGCERLARKKKYSDFGLKERVENGRATNPRTNIEANGTRNNHPTCKPIKLMSYLITLGSREGDIVLDPFIGSGTTAIAAKMLRRRYIGYETDPDYCRIAEARLSAVEERLI